MSQSMTKTERLINRLKNSDPQHFVRLCHFHFERLLGDEAKKANVRELLGAGFTATKTTTKPRVFQFRKMKIMKDKKPGEVAAVFGVPLTEEIIFRIYPLIQFLRQSDCQRQEGIFRKSGHLMRQKTLRDKLNNGDDIERELENGPFTVHDCACVLKTFLGEMPEPLFTDRHFKAHMIVAAIPCESRRLEMLQILMLLLPWENLILLRHVLELLNRTSQQRENRMTASSLATLFSPHVMIPRKMATQQMQAVLAKATVIVAFAIEKANVLFRIPELLLRDVAIYWEEMEGVKIRLTPGKPLPPGRKSRLLRYSQSSGLSTLHESCDDLPNSKPDNLYATTPGHDVKQPSHKRRSRSLGDTIKNIFRSAARKCKNSAHVSPTIPAPAFNLDGVLDNSDFSSPEEEEEDSPKNVSRIHIVDVKVHKTTSTPTALFSSDYTSPDSTFISPLTANGGKSLTPVNKCQAAVNSRQDTVNGYPAMIDGQPTPPTYKQHFLKKVHPLYSGHLRIGIGFEQHVGEKPSLAMRMNSAPVERRSTAFLETEDDDRLTPVELVCESRIFAVTSKSRPFLSDRCEDDQQIYYDTTFNRWYPEESV